MDWVEAAKSIPPIENRDLLRFKLSVEDQEALLKQYNRALSMAASDSADISAIALRKLLTRFPDWGEAALLYGICLSLDGKMNRASASFQHALKVGLRSEPLSYLAQVCIRDVNAELSTKAHTPEDNNPAKALISSVIPKSNPLVQEENQIRPRSHMQAPILMKASRHPNRTKMASDRERRELLMQSTSSNGELPDDEIDVSIPKTPAEKLRITLIILGAVALLTGLYFLTTLWVLPEIDRVRERNRAIEKLGYLTGALYDNSEDPEISEIIRLYESEYIPSETAAEEQAP
jgi:hypothetical protein